MVQIKKRPLAKCLQKAKLEIVAVRTSAKKGCGCAAATRRVHAMNPRRRKVWRGPRDIERPNGQKRRKRVRYLQKPKAKRETFLILPQL